MFAHAQAHATERARDVVLHFVFCMRSQVMLPTCVRITTEWALDQNWDHFGAMVEFNHVRLQLSSFFAAVTRSLSPDSLVEFASARSSEPEAALEAAAVAVAAGPAGVPIGVAARAAPTPRAPSRRANAELGSGRGSEPDSALPVEGAGAVAPPPPPMESVGAAAAPPPPPGNPEGIRLR